MVYSVLAHLPPLIAVYISNILELQWISLQGLIPFGKIPVVSFRQQGAGHSFAGSSHTSWLTRKPAGAAPFWGEIPKGRPRVLRAGGIPSTKHSAARKELALFIPVRERIALFIPVRERKELWTKVPGLFQYDLQIKACVAFNMNQRHALRWEK